MVINCKTYQKTKELEISEILQILYYVRICNSHVSVHSYLDNTSRKSI